VAQDSLGKKQDPISKITRAKMAGGIAQAVEYLPSKWKVLNLNPSFCIPPKKGKEVLKIMNTKERKANACLSFIPFFLFFLLIDKAHQYLLKICL
jgi:hypothetical protein